MSLAFAIPSLMVVALFALIVTLIVVRNRREP